MTCRQSAATCPCEDHSAHRSECARRGAETRRLREGGRAGEGPPDTTDTGMALTALSKALAALDANDLVVADQWAETALERVTLLAVRGATYVG